MASSAESEAVHPAVAGAEDKPQLLDSTEETSSATVGIPVVPSSNENETKESTGGEPEGHDDPTSKTVVPASHDAESGEAPSQVISQSDGSIPQSAHESQTPSIAALSVDSEELTDDDSALGDPSIYTTSTSVRSSVYDFVMENGRTYHAYREGKYELPNDEREQDRLDLQHHLFLLTLSGDLYNAPIKNLPGGVHNALDIGTGTGIWAIDFATEFPAANVVGTDLSPIQPEFVPPNCHFEVDDAEDR